MRTASKPLIIVLLVFCLGLHWSALQSLAWAGMFIAYSQKAPLRQAVSMTFDGQHPCSVCHLVAEGRDKERRQDQTPLKTEKLTDFGLVWLAPEFFFVRAFPCGPSRDLFGWTRLSIPPKPPPRP